MTTPEPPLTPVDPAKLGLVAGSEPGTFSPLGAVSAVGTARGVGSAPAVSSAYTAAAAMAESTVAAAAYIDAETTLQALSLTHLRILAADKEGRHGLLRQLGLEPISPDIVSVLAGGEIQNRTDAKQDQKWAVDKWVLVAVAACGWLVALIGALLR